MVLTGTHLSMNIGLHVAANCPTVITHHTGAADKPIVVQHRRYCFAGVDCWADGATAAALQSG